MQLLQNIKISLVKTIVTNAKFCQSDKNQEEAESNNMAMRQAHSKQFLIEYTSKVLWLKINLWASLNHSCMAVVCYMLEIITLGIILLLKLVLMNPLGQIMN